MSPELVKILAMQGAGVMCFSILLYALVKLAMYFGKPFIEAQKQQAEAMLEQAQSMRAQANCMEQMQGSVKEFVARDNNDHREILLGLQVVIKEVQQLGTEVKAQGESLKALCEETGKLRPAGAVARLG